MEVLPPSVVLRSKARNLYVCFVDTEAPARGYLTPSDDKFTSPYAKLETEQATRPGATPGSVHIRCCYNNRYWRRYSQDTAFIVAAADEPEEDESKWSCKLFKPEFSNSTKDDGVMMVREVRLFHVQLQRYVRVRSSNLVADVRKWSIKDNAQVFGVIDLGSVFTMPKHVAFKGDNGRYLTIHKIEEFPDVGDTDLNTMILMAILFPPFGLLRNPYFRFSSTNPKDASVGQEISVNADGTIHIKSLVTGENWVRDSKSCWVQPMSIDTTKHNANALFYPVKVDHKTVALRNLGNNLFCRRCTYENKVDCLCAWDSHINPKARLEVEEHVVSKRIDNVQFRFQHARKYNVEVISSGTREIPNTTSELLTGEVSLEITEKSITTWKSSSSVKLCGSIEFKIPNVPVIDALGIKLSVEHQSGTEWGETKEFSVQLTDKYVYKVKSGKRLKVRLVATKCMCDIPFSYVETDLLHTGKTRTTYMVDGVYTVSQCYDQKIDLKEESL